LKGSSKRFWLAFLSSAFIALTGCSGTTEAPKEAIRVLGEAYIGPYSAVIRKDISPAAPETAKLKHGDKVEIVDRRRRFFRIRTASGALGWIDSRQLMNQAQMDALKLLAIQYAKTPRIGQVFVYEPLNLHNEPNRQAPSFTQIPENARADVLLYRLAPRVPFATPKLIEDPKPVVRASRKRSKKYEKNEEKVPPPPPPAAPEPPEDWLDLSNTPKGGDGPEPPKAPEQPPVRQDDWTLVRLSDGKVGWALSSMLIMAIPDDVAQYSEGHRIMGYWPLGEVTDENGVKKNHWLWVTQSQRGAPFDFDGFRIFMYTTKRHRYEQAYREKKLQGYFPVEVTRPGRQKDYLAEFKIVTQNEEGRKIQRTFAFLGYRVTKLDEQLWVPPKGQPAALPKEPEAPAAEKPWYKRLFGS
jgi:hypothetical protein